MAEVNTVARPYTKAAFEYALGKGNLDQWSATLALAAAAAEDEKVARVLGNPALTDAQKADLMISLCEEADEAGKNFLKLLADNKRLAILPEVSAQFAKLKAEQEKSLDIEVTTAFELQDEQQEKLAQALKTKLGREVVLTSQVDKSILGGAVVRTDDLVIDGSVRARLAKLAEAMNS
ncbi:F0F1 ATP synthase subunit delta [Neptuniibacter halophilus]|uniref:F0F1 ATP synthase subunit delta n=1 Tax=Neptuniibacter halophilus TaxID=651666 RepID=UPI0025745209|nr:F0F1 ATP synthase subunit delta [Neptuniibacter halophilus]